MKEIVYEKLVGPLHYYIKRDGKFFRLWLNGCCIGTPRNGNIIEFKAKTITEAKCELKASAIRELSRRIDAKQAEVHLLIKAFRDLV